MYHVYFGLGSNQGEREEFLQHAIEALKEQVEITAVSRIYETEAWGIEDQPKFLNMCVAGKSELPPLEMLRFVKGMEDHVGRVPTFHWGPREIDIDILIYEEVVVRSAALDVPHKGVPNRSSVLVPLADIAPELKHPLTGKTVEQMRDEVDKSGVVLWQDREMN